MKLEQKIVKKLLEKKLKKDKLDAESRKELLDTLKEVVMSEKKLQKTTADMITLMKEMAEATKRSVDIAEKSIEAVEDSILAIKNLKLEKVGNDFKEVGEEVKKLGKKEEENMQGFGSLMMTLFAGLIKFIGEFFSRKTIKTSLPTEHYLTPQRVVVVDPVSGKALDWSRVLSKSQQAVRGGGGSGAGGASQVVTVPVTGNIDGVNTIFTLSSTPANGVLYLSLGRQEQVEDVDFTRSGNTIIYSVAPDISLSGYPHRAVIY